MKLLLDENLSRRIVPFIQESYPESTHVVLAGLEQADDQCIRQWAINNDFIIMTKDADFYEMSRLYGQPPKIIWLKMGNQSKAAVIKVLQENREMIDQVLMTEDKTCIEIF